MSEFYGLNLQPYFKYEQMLSKPLHLSGVALDDGDFAKFYLTIENRKHVVATLNKATPQAALDLNFSMGDRLTFQSVGNGTMSVVGYVYGNQASLGGPQLRSALRQRANNDAVANLDSGDGLMAIVGAGSGDTANRNGGAIVPVRVTGGAAHQELDPHRPSDMDGENAAGAADGAAVEMSPAGATVEENSVAGEAAMEVSAAGEAVDNNNAAEAATVSNAAGTAMEARPGAEAASGNSAAGGDGQQRGNAISCRVYRVHHLSQGMGQGEGPLPGHSSHCTCRRLRYQGQSQRSFRHAADDYQREAMRCVLERRAAANSSSNNNNNSSSSSSRPCGEQRPPSSRCNGQCESDTDNPFSPNLLCRIPTCTAHRPLRNVVTNERVPRSTLMRLTRMDYARGLVKTNVRPDQPQ